MSECEWCAEVGPDETPWLAQRHESHRAFHSFGRTVWAQMVEPWAIPAVRWIDRGVSRLGGGRVPR